MDDHDCTEHLLFHCIMNKNWLQGVNQRNCIDKTNCVLYQSGHLTMNLLIRAWNSKNTCDILQKSGAHCFHSSVYPP